MGIQIENQNVVIIARNFNPTIFSQLWLVKEGIISESDFIPPLVFSPFAVDFRTNQFHLLVVPDRIQLTFSQPKSENQNVLYNILGKIIKTLPHTPYVAIGFNNNFIFTPEDQSDYAIKLKNTLIADNNPLYPNFLSDDSRFGFYCSKNYLEMRLRLDVKPRQITSQQGMKTESITFDFNYHYDLCEANKVKEIESFLEKWTQTEELSKEIVSQFSLKWSNNK
jgi:cellulase/cellobiase CelA1